MMRVVVVDCPVCNARGQITRGGHRPKVDAPKEESLIGACGACGGAGRTELAVDYPEEAEACHACAGTGGFDRDGQPSLHACVRVCPECSRHGTRQVPP